MTVLSIFFLLTSPKVFLFYTDPGSGALILQLIAGAFLGGLFYLRKIKYFLFRKNSREHSEKPHKSES